MPPNPQRTRVPREREDASQLEEINVIPPWPDPMAAGAFHGLAGRFVRECQQHSEADPHALLVQFVVAFGASVGTGAHMPVGGSRHHANEFVLVVGDTAKGRKGTSWAYVERVLKTADPTLSIRSGLTSGEGLIHHIRDATERHTKGAEQVSDPGIPDKRLLVVETEFAGPLATMKRMASTLSPVLRDAWDGRDLGTLGKRQPDCASGPHVSVVGHITATELAAKVDTVEVANGFANRFLFVASRRSRVLPFGGQLAEETIASMGQEVANAIAFASECGELKWSDEAASLWCLVYEPFSKGCPGLSGAATSRAEAHVVRLALIYALLDQSPAIEMVHLRAALAVWIYCAATVAHLFHDRMGNTTLEKAMELLTSQPNGVTDDELHGLSGRNRPGHLISEDLVAQGLAKRFKQTSPGRGRPVHITKAIPHGQRSLQHHVEAAISSLSSEPLQKQQEGPHRKDLSSISSASCKDVAVTTLRTAMTGPGLDKRDRRKSESIKTGSFEDERYEIDERIGLREF